MERGHCTYRQFNLGIKPEVGGLLQHDSREARAAAAV